MIEKFIYHLKVIFLGNYDYAKDKKVAVKLTSIATTPNNDDFALRR